ncbi:MAG TPA: zf-HC2 domain-containing protein [Pseudonocardiaceae bacterium]|jgi:anti-sigma factor RsiW|nr:zf-HC2 domain-containing protein [Pseudonocardiaceae bacterium]
MTDLRGWGLPEQHLLPDAVVAYVDGELSATAYDRASAHLAHCPFCAAEAVSQQQARAAVRTAKAPSVPAGLLDNLRAIPQEVDLPNVPDGLAVTEDGQLVSVLRPDRVQFGSGPALGETRPLGSGSAVLGHREQRRFGGRRARHGAGVVVSGLMLGALALVAPGGEASQSEPVRPPAANRGPESINPLQADEADRVGLLRPVASFQITGR